MPSPDRHVIVDGSNIATEGRSLPSLSQLDEAVQAFQSDHPDASVTVVVDATFAHRIAKKERKAFDAAVDAGEIIVPPAGAIGRGDAFILQVAAKGDAKVLSNDSFQEFHGEHEWLFDEGRLIGAKPVDGIGWVFVDRVPVRGPESRRATRASSRSSKEPTKRGSGSRSKSDSDSTSKSGSRGGSRSKSDSDSKPSDKTPEPKPKKSSRSRSRSRKSSGDAGAGSKASDAKQNDSKKDDGRGGSSRSSRKTKELNSPSEFLGFVTKHSIGDVVRGSVERFSSHGCYLRVSDAQCYLPVKAMGDPPPSKARDLVSAGGEVEVRVESLDADRRGINVELIRVIDPSSASAKRRGRRKQTQPSQQSTAVADGSAREANPTRSETNVASKTTKKPARKSAKKATAGSAKKTAVKKTTRKAPAKKATAKKATAKKAPAKKAPAKKTTAKKAPAKKAPAKKATAKKATAKKATAKAPARATTSKRAQKATAKRAAKKTPARKSAKRSRRR